LRKWEYKVVDLIKEIEKESTKNGGVEEHWLRTENLEEVLNKFGAQGWELVDIHFILNREEAVVVGFFKRPL
jgi:hypothetical protein